MKTKLLLPPFLILICSILFLCFSLLSGCKSENRTFIRLPSGTTNATATLKLDLALTNAVRLAPTGSIALRLDQEQPLRTTGKLDVVLSTNPIRVITTNTIPLKLSADAPVNLQATNPFTLKIDTNAVIQARVTVSPVQIIVTNAAVNTGMPNLLSGSNLTQIVIVSNIIQQTLCCTNADGRTNRNERKDPEVPRFSKAGGPSGLLWGLPVLCVVLAGLFARPLGRYIGVIIPLNTYDEQRKAIAEWLETRLGKEASEKLRGWIELKEPIRDRHRDFQRLKGALFTQFPGRMPDDVLTQLAELEKTVPLLPTSPGKDYAIGFTAAALCPVFLSFSSSNLVVAAADNPFAFFAFLGFCFLAAMLGAEFITAVLKGFRALIVLAEKKIAEGK